MYKVMLPCNHEPVIFPKLVDKFRTTMRIHRLVRLHLIAGAQFTLAWVRLFFEGLIVGKAPTVFSLKEGGLQNIHHTQVEERGPSFPK
jgi:hypothetical protein